MSFLLGLTGSIGMGKSTTAALFADEGCAIWDADAAVHRMYATGGAAVEAIRQVLPRAIVQGAVSRDQLKALISESSETLGILEKIVHPLVAADRADFIASASQEIIVLDIPLLFETGGNAHVDAVACVTVAADVQEARVMARGTMSAAQFATIRNKQMPNDDKCARSDFLIETDTLDHARAQVKEIVKTLHKRLSDA